MAKELKKVNVVTVGVGFTGGIALAECAKAGLSVVGLERGDRRSVEDFQDIHDEWRYAVNYGLMQDLSKETITFRNTEEMRALPMRKLGSFLLGDGLGGAGVHWNGMNFRFSRMSGMAKTSWARSISCRITPSPTTRWSRIIRLSRWLLALPESRGISAESVPSRMPCLLW